MAKKENHHEEHDKNPFIAIPSSLGGMFLVIVIMFLIFAKDSLGILLGLIWGFVVLGIVAMAFAYQSTKKKK
jgi:L-asparagine transporter-like permease